MHGSASWLAIDTLISEIDGAQGDSLVPLAERLGVTPRALRESLDTFEGDTAELLRNQLQAYEEELGKTVSWAQSLCEPKERLPDTAAWYEWFDGVEVGPREYQRRVAVKFLIDNDCLLSAVRALSAIRFDCAPNEGNKAVLTYVANGTGPDSFRSMVIDLVRQDPEWQGAFKGAMVRRRLPEERVSITHKFNVAGHEGYLTVGLFDDNTPGELFITMAKEGSTIGGLMDCIGTLVSEALQHGVPIESLVTKFTHLRFEPAGMTHNPDIPFAKSIVDYIFRWLGMKFIAGYREANAPSRPNRERSLSPAEAQNRGWSLIETPIEQVPAEKKKSEVTYVAAALSEATANMQMDAPACDVCGTITVRNGSCYKCLNCGNSMGCS